LLSGQPLTSYRVPVPIMSGTKHNLQTTQPNVELYYPEYGKPTVKKQYIEGSYPVSPLYMSVFTPELIGLA
jgi:hypothetical protein